MTDETRHTVAMRVFPGPLVVVLLLVCLTGNCSTCGFGKDYLGAAVGMEPTDDG